MLKLRESVFGRAIEENSGQKKKKNVISLDQQTPFN